MEHYTLPEDMHIICVTATSFPEGIMAAFSTLHEKIPVSKERAGFGISYMGPDGKIIYKAGTLEMEEGEAEKYGFERFTIKKGEYLTEMIRDWKKNVSLIGETFQKFITLPNIDTHGYCVEWYQNDNDVLCMITAASNAE